jgi:hypothetical protein
MQPSKCWHAFSVDLTEPKTIALVEDGSSGYFCCANAGPAIWNSSTQLFVIATHYNSSPFSLPDGFAIWDRSTDSTVVPTVASSCSSASVSATCSSTAKAYSKSELIAGDAGIGVPLAVLLGAAVAWALLLRRQLEQLKGGTTIQAQPIPADVPGKEGVPATIALQSDYQRTDLGGETLPAELHHRQIVGELDFERPVAEMEAHNT